jgi:rhodanese-related sulfurtransferase
LGYAFRDRSRYRDWGSIRSLCRLAGIGSGANDPSTAPAPDRAARKLKSNGKVAVLDLLNFEESDSESLEAIPGAFSVDPSRLRRSPHITVPDDVKIILYSASERDTVSAVALKRIGIDNVWVPEGGQGVA